VRWIALGEEREGEREEQKEAGTKKNKAKPIPYYTTTNLR
jgi:hypothetical protein